MRKIFFKLIFIFFCNSTFGQTVLPAIFSQNTVLLKQNSPYIINTSTLVSDNITLTIEAGVDITITGALNVRGIILALGAEIDSIRFHCNNSTAPSIRIVKGLNDTLNTYSKFNYCSIRSNNIGIYGFNRKIEINNSKISNCLSDGIMIENGALKVFQSKIDNNLRHGIYSLLTGGNSNKIAMDSCFIHKTSISLNKASGVDWGLTGNDGANLKSYNVSFSENKFENNSYGGLKLRSGSNKVYIYGNLFKDNKSSAITLSTGSGGNVPTVFIFDNVIQRNNGAFESGNDSFGRIWNNIFIENSLNFSSSFDAAFRPKVFDFMSTSCFFNNNVIAFNQFENLLTFWPGFVSSTLNVSRNLFFQNRPQNILRSSFFNMDERSQQNGFNFDFTRNNFFLDETTTYFFKNEHRISDLIVNENFKNREKPNFDGLNGFYGFVYEINQLTTPDINAPISPVRFAIIDSVGAKFLVWKQNPERDLKGYKIYFGKISDFNYANTVDVGMKNLYRIPNEHSLVTDFTVTAYDKEADGNKDFFEGHESWYADPQIGPGIIIKKGTEVLQSPISTCPNQTYRLKSVGSCASVIWSNGSTARDLTLSNLTSNASYYFDCINNIPITHSFRSETVNFYVNPSQFNHRVVLPNESVQTFNAQKIGSSSVFGSNSNIKMEAGAQVVLEPGFFFNGAKQFTAEIKNCPN